MERDFLGLGSKLSPMTVKEETTQDLAPSRGMMQWSFSSKSGSVPQILSFGTSHQDRHIKSVNDHLLPCGEINENRTYYSSEQNNKAFLGGKSFINSFINDQTLGGSPTMAPPVSVFPAPNNIRCSSNPTQLTIFYAGSVSVYQDISPDKAQAIMLLAGNGPQAKPISMPKPQKPVHHSPATTYSPNYLPSVSYIVSETGGGSNGVTLIGPTKTMASLASMRNNQTDASNMAPPVGLPQTRKASLARFLEKRKERIINVSPYYVDNKSSIDCITPMSECWVYRKRAGIRGSVLRKRKERFINVSPSYVDNKSSIDCRTPMSECVSSSSALRPHLVLNVFSLASICILYIETIV